MGIKGEEHSICGEGGGLYESNSKLDMHFPNKTQRDGKGPISQLCGKSQLQALLLSQFTYIVTVLDMSKNQMEAIQQTTDNFILHNL